MTTSPEHIRAQCSCGRVLKAPIAFAGRHVRCKHCRSVIAVPGAGETAASSIPVRSGHAIQLRLLAGGHVGQLTPVSTTPFFIGRRQDASLTTHDEATSQLHCSIVEDGGALFVVDHGSTNGTFLDEHRVEGRALLHLGARLRIGPTYTVVVEPRAPGGVPAGPEVLRLSGLPWGRRLTKKISCANCWHKFSPEDVFFVSKHADLLGDPVLGGDEYLRFQPTRFTVKGEALDPRGVPTHALACPRCHLNVPEALLEVAPLFVSMIGSPASGKSHFLASMSWELRRLMPRARLAFTDADAAANRVIHEYEQTLFLNPRPDEPTEIRKTQRDDPRLYRSVLLDGGAVRFPVPLQFSLWPAAGHHERHHSSRVGRVLVIYDNAGEDFLPGADERGSAVTEHLGRVHVLLFLFDPTQDPRFNAACGAAPQRASADAEVGLIVRQETVLRDAISRIRRLKGLTEGERLRRPLIVIVSKLDAWESLLPKPVGDEPYVEESGTQPLKVLTARVEEVSDSVRAVLLRLCPEFVTTAESLTESVTYVPVSSLGAAPELVERDGTRYFGIRPRDIKPRWVTVPMTYCLARWAPGLLLADVAAKEITAGDGDTASADQLAAVPAVDLTSSDISELPELSASGEFSSGSSVS